MAATPGSPGIYVSSTAEGRATNIPVPTSVAAFIGRAARGPENTPVTVVSWADYERAFGGLSEGSAVSYQIQAFFANGGGQAIAVRLFHPPVADATACIVVHGQPTGPSFEILAANPGSWGNALSASVDTKDITDTDARQAGIARSELFNLSITLSEAGAPAITETFRCVTLDPKGATHYLGTVLAQQSALVRYDPQDALKSVLGAPIHSGQGSGGRDSAPLDLADYLGDEVRKTGLYALEQAPAFNILCIPPDTADGDTSPYVYQTAANYCAARRAMLILDPPKLWTQQYKAGQLAKISLDALGSFGADEARSSVVYFPRIVATDPLQNDATRAMPICGYVAGIWAQTDTLTGPWKAPAGITTPINGILGLELALKDSENGVLNPLGINSLRSFPMTGTVVWGARTMRGADVLADDYAYVPVRRTLLYIQNWVIANTKSAVFEPNDESLWAALRLQVSAFMDGLWKQGAFFGTTPSQAYFVRCDGSTNTLDDIASGRVNIEIGFAPARPAEFVVTTVQLVAAAAG